MWGQMDAWLLALWCVCESACGFTHIYDPLADKIMCDHCCNKYPLSLYYFLVYKLIVTEAATVHIVAENQPNYINPAKQPAVCFENYRMQQCRKFAAEHTMKDADKEINGPLPADVVPAHDVPMCMLASVVNAICSDFERQCVYAEQHKWALAAVGPVLNNILCDAEHISKREVG